MDNQWIMHRGDVGLETRQMETAAVLITLVDPAQTAVKLEQATEVRSDQARLVYLIHPGCLVEGSWVPTSEVRQGLEDGTLEALHPALEARAGLENAKALLDWMRTGRSYRLRSEADGQRTVYEPGPAPLIGNVETIRTHSLAKAAALGRLGMPLYNITGSATSPQFIVHRRSEGMLDADGCPVTYDAAELIMGEINDTLEVDHPWMLAYRARLNFELLQQAVAQEEEVLLLTPDIVRKGAAYDPTGLHSYISADAPGHVWDKVERDFFG